MTKTPTTSKHIFLQLDTTSIIAEIGTKDSYSPEQINEIALANCLLYEQGSMVLGDPITRLIIHTEPMQEIFFTILPLQLFSKHKLYFTEAAFTPTGKATIPVTVDNPGGHFMSFKITIDPKAPIGSAENFSLTLNLEHQAGDQLPPLTITIDPVLQVVQPKP